MARRTFYRRLAPLAPSNRRYTAIDFNVDVELIADHALRDRWETDPSYPIYWQILHRNVFGEATPAGLAAKLGLSMGRFYHALYRIQAELGRTWASGCTRRQAVPSIYPFPFLHLQEDYTVQDAA